MSLIIQRRKFITGLAGLIASPALVKASSLMPVKTYVEPACTDLNIAFDSSRLVYVVTTKWITLSEIKEKYPDVNMSNPHEIKYTYR